MRRCVLVIALTQIFGIASMVAAQASDASAQPSPAVVAELKKFDLLLDGMLDWMIELYDPASGGFFGDIQLRHDPKHRPTIQTTLSVVHALRDSDLLGGMPESMRAGIVRFVQSNQDRETGLFWDQHYPQTIARRKDRQIGRTTGQAMGLLTILGAEPKYPVAQGESGQLPVHVRSLAAWKVWLTQTLGDQPGYGQLDDLGSQSIYLNMIPEDRRKDYIDAAVDYVNAKQNPVTGLWIGPARDLQQPADGAYKYLLFLRGVGRPMPNADRIRESVRAWWKANDTTRVDNACFVCNPIALVSRLGPEYSDPTWSEAEQISIIDWHQRHLAPYRRADGGLSGWLDDFPLFIEGARFGKAKGPQSDLRGASQAGVARRVLYAMTATPMPPLPKSDGFWIRFAKRWPQVVRDPAIAAPTTPVTPVSPPVTGTPVERFHALEARPWRRVFSEPGTGNWQERWSLDGKFAKVVTSPTGLEFSAGPEINNHAHHAVLWTKSSFSGDCRIEFTVTRLDTSHRNACLLYVQATGSDKTGFHRNISRWADLRAVPLMRLYFQNMNLYSISFASFDVDNNDKNADYIRTRRYIPGMDSKPGPIIPPSHGAEPTRTGLFKTGEPNRVIVIKAGKDLYMKIAHGDRERLIHWNADAHDLISDGRIGLRHMYGRSARYSDFAVSTLADDKAGNATPEPRE